MLLATEPSEYPSPLEIVNRERSEVFETLSFRVDDMIHNITV